MERELDRPAARQADTQFMYIKRKREKIRGEARKGLNKRKAVKNPGTRSRLQLRAGHKENGDTKENVTHKKGKLRKK